MDSSSGSGASDALALFRGWLIECRTRGPLFGYSGCRSGDIESNHVTSEALQVELESQLPTVELGKRFKYPVRHAPPSPEVRIAYPIFDQIDNQWVYVLPEDENSVADVH
jgi:hypothetical protein